MKFNRHEIPSFLNFIFNFKMDIGFILNYFKNILFNKNIKLKDKLNFKKQYVKYGICHVSDKWIYYLTLCDYLEKK